ncbi:MAG TPA: ABC transporter substrate-binding protein [Acidimicrobiia bacterium]
MNDASHPPRKWVFALVALALGCAACGTAETVDTTASAEAPSAATSSETTGPSQISPTTTAPAADEPFATVEAGNGVVEIPKRPTAIVSLSPTATEMLFAIGAGDQVVAVDEFSYYPEEAPVTDLSGFTPNLESIGAYAPDLVVVSNDLDGIVGALEAVDIPVLLLPAAVEFADVFDQMRTLGAATGNLGAAAEAAATLEAEIQAAIDDAGSLADGLTVYHELDPTLYSITSDTFIGRVYGAFGLVNIADPADAEGFGYPQLSAEYVIEANPELIFVTDCCGDTPDTVAQRPGWDNITAVERGAVTVVDSDVSSRWGPRIVQFFRAISDVIVGLNA